jgi:hypothetical protein
VLNFNKRDKGLKFVRKYVKSKIYIISLEPIYIKMKTEKIFLIDYGEAMTSYLTLCAKTASAQSANSKRSSDYSDEATTSE